MLRSVPDKRDFALNSDTEGFSRSPCIMQRQESIGRTPGSVEDLKKFLKYNRFWHGVSNNRRRMTITQDSISEKGFSMGVFTSGGDASGKRTRTGRVERSLKKTSHLISHA